jgi:hypothetical protein
MITNQKPLKVVGVVVVGVVMAPQVLGDPLDLKGPQDLKEIRARRDTQET